jgi:histidinol-phosphate aminotransferase
MPLSRRTFLRFSGAGAAGAVAVSSIGELCEATDFAGDGVGRTLASDAWIRLHRNENAYGPSESVKAALRRALGVTNRYTEAAAEMLQERLAVLHGVAREQIVLGCGSGEILRAAVETFATPHKNVVVAAPTCSVIDHYARSAGADVVSVALSPDYSHNLHGMLARSNRNTGLAYICNPNNPTGTTTRSDELEQFLQKLPLSVHVVIDEAYYDYVEKSSDYRSFVEQADDDSRIIVTRTFSKIHGLAGLRVGYAVTSSTTARIFESRRLADNLNAVAALAAIAALDDVAHVHTAMRRNVDDRQEFLNQANARMVRAIDSQANFVMLKTSRPAGEVRDHFSQHRILLAPPSPDLPSYLRVSLGLPTDMQEFWRVWDLMPGHHMTP